MNPIIDRIAIIIEEEVKKLDYVEALVYFGSYARKEHNFYSDLDAFIYLNTLEDNQKENRLKRMIRNVLINDEEGISNEFELYDKWVIFTEKTFIKLELSIKDINDAK
ncbi:MAG: nucleotidyltransferase domain-containing protein, partial [Candidatus Thorarchaeota archaeon]